MQVCGLWNQITFARLPMDGVEFEAMHFLDQLWMELNLRLCLSDNLRAMEFECGGIMAQNELVATNALVGRFIHWMGCVFSFDVRCVHHNPFFFCF
jgi:hypothetical protein